MRRLLRRFTALLRSGDEERDRREQDLKDELAFHFNTEVERRVAAGQSPAQALAAARRQFGNVPLVEDVTREMWGWSMQDYKLGVRMLAKYPGLTIAGGLALAIALGVGAGWYEVSGQLIHPRIPLPDGDRLVEFEAFDRQVSEDEQRLLHDFVGWRRDFRSIEDISAYRTVERPLTVDDVRTDPVLIAQMTASAFRVARVPPLLGRTLIEEDERPGAQAVIVLGHQVWQRWFGGRADVVGREVRLGDTPTMVVGVMPESFTFPVNHRAWVPFALRASGYAPLEGGAITAFGRLAAGVSRAEAAVELETLAARVAAESPETHAHLALEISPYGGESPNVPLLEYVLTHLPIVLVLFVACTTVGTLVYARTATREAEIAVRSALGAGRRRILMQLFVEALVLTSAAAVVGLTAAHFVLNWGVETLWSVANAGGIPFWMHAGITFRTVLYATGLAVAAAALLGVLPALKVTGSHLHAELRNLGAGGSTLRFGRVWTGAMVVQVALTVMFLPPAIGIATEAVRDRIIRARFPADQYLSVPVRMDLAPGSADESEQAFVERAERTYAELERRVAQEPGVVAVTYADRLPGAEPNVQNVELEPLDGSAPQIRQIWTATIGPGFFEAFDKPIVAGRAFHGGDRVPGARTVLVNEAFARRITGGASPVGRRVRFAGTEDGTREPWLEIVGIVRDVGMTPTDFGEGAYVFVPATPGMLPRPVMGVRVKGDAAALAPRVRAIAADLDVGLRLANVQRLDEVVWVADLGLMLGAAAIGIVVGLGLFISAAGIFALMSVTVARRTREIGLRTALGASRSGLLRSIFSRAAALVGSGVIVGNVALLLLITLGDEAIPWGFVRRALMVTSLVMMTVGLLACVGPARRALRISPIDALRET